MRDTSLLGVGLQGHGKAHFLPPKALPKDEVERGPGVFPTLGQHVHWPFHPQVSLNAWFWSTVFHTRDTDLTEVRALISLSSWDCPREPRRVAEQCSGVQLQLSRDHFLRVLAF